MHAIAIPRPHGHSSPWAAHVFASNYKLHTGALALCALAHVVIVLNVPEAATQHTLGFIATLPLLAGRVARSARCRARLLLTWAICHMDGTMPPTLHSVDIVLRRDGSGQLAALRRPFTALRKWSRQRRRTTNAPCIVSVVEVEPPSSPVPQMQRLRSGVLCWAACWAA